MWWRSGRPRWRQGLWHNARLLMRPTMCFVYPLLIGCICLNCLRAQDNQPKYSLFGCSQGAVESNLTNKPELRFVPLDQRHGDIVLSGSEHQFVFHGAQSFDRVNVYFAATLGEAGVGRGSSAGLRIYAETA